MAYQSISLKKATLGAFKLADANIILHDSSNRLLAFRYKRKEDCAPVLVNKSIGPRSKQLLNVAKRHNIPAYQAKIFVDELFDCLEIGDPVPEKFYTTMATHLARAFKQQNKKPGAWCSRLIDKNPIAQVKLNYELEFESVGLAIPVGSEKPCSVEEVSPFVPSYSRYPDHIRYHPSIEDIDGFDLRATLKHVCSLWHINRNIPVVFYPIPDPSVPTGAIKVFLRGFTAQVIHFSDDKAITMSLELIHGLGELFRKYRYDLISVASLDFILKNCLDASGETRAYIESKGPGFCSGLLTSMKYLARLFGSLPPSRTIVEEYSRIDNDTKNQESLGRQLAHHCAKQICDSLLNQSYHGQIKVLRFPKEIETIFCFRSKNEKALLSFDDYLDILKTMETVAKKSLELGYIPVFEYSSNCFFNYAYLFNERNSFIQLPHYALLDLEMNSGSHILFEELEVSISL